MATKTTTVPARPIPSEEDPKSPYEGLYHLLRRCIHGHDTDIDSICHYQDVFGHSCEEDLEKAAEGEYKEVFYRLYDEAYGTVQMINFYSKHSAYVRHLHEQIDDLECRVEELKDDCAKIRQERQNRDNDICDARARIEELKKNIELQKKDNDELIKTIFRDAQEIMRLKAALYDMKEKYES